MKRSIANEGLAPARAGRLLALGTIVMLVVLGAQNKYDSG
jgi:hypothetical protein